MLLNKSSKNFFTKTIKLLNSKFQIPNSMALILILFSIFYLILFKDVSAATLYFDPQSGSFNQGDVFAVNIRVDGGGECINAAEVNVKFSRDALRAVDFSDGESILSVWVKRPEIKQEEGIISFIGGIPGGYCGRVPGDPGISNVLGKIIFRVPGFQVLSSRSLGNSANLEFFDTKIYLNDGLGSEAALDISPANFAIIKNATYTESVKDEWYNAVLKTDKISPEPFLIELQKEESVKQGKFFIVFSTVDKESGIDRYEIMEADAEGKSAVTGKKAIWRAGQSPYFLEDQGLRSVIRVKAVDKAGNERVTEYIPQREYYISESFWQKRAAVIIAATGVLLVIIIVAIIIFRKRKYKQSGIN